MKKTIKGIAYDTETAANLTTFPDASAETELLRTTRGHFFLHITSTHVDGRPFPRSLFVEQRIEGWPWEPGTRERVARVETIKPLSRAQALSWCIRKHIPRTFHKDLARFLG